MATNRTVDGFSELLMWPLHTIVVRMICNPEVFKSPFQAIGQTIALCGVSGFTTGLGPKAVMTAVSFIVEATVPRLLPVNFRVRTLQFL